MTCGIYKLNFNNTDKVYIGQSINIEKRFKEHIYELCNQIHSIKMNAAYSLFGIPTLEILIECDSTELDITENEAIDIWNSKVLGFNTSTKASGGSSLKGEDSPTSKYSNIQIIEIFNYLIDFPEVSFKDISNITEVPYGTIAMISQGSNHKWLAEKYPDRYLQLLSLKNTRYSLSNSAIRKNINYPKILSPEGICYKVESPTSFAKLHNLDLSALSRVLNRNRESHKGWRLL